MQIGKTLKRLRQTKDLTLLKLSQMSSVQMATLSRIENNKANGTIQGLSKISKVLGLKLSEFFSEVEKEDYSF